MSNKALISSKNPGLGKAGACPYLPLNGVGRQGGYREVWSSSHNSSIWSSTALDLLHKHYVEVARIYGTKESKGLRGECPEVLSRRPWKSGRVKGGEKMILQCKATRIFSLH